MTEAQILLSLYKAKKVAKPVPISQEFAPLFAQLAGLLDRIANKEIPAPLIEVAQPDVKVTVDAPKIDFSVPEIKLPAPIINNENYDYTSLFIELKRAVDKLTKTLEERPKKWEVQRNNQGFISTVEGIEKD